MSVHITLITTSENLRGVSGIYCIIHRDTGHCYVGSSVNIGKRLDGHLGAARRGVQTAIYRALNFYGKQSFDFEVLERCEQSKLRERENFYIALLDSCVNGFNTQAKANEKYGAIPNEITRKRMAVARTGRVFSPETREKIAATHRGIKGWRHSQETKKKMRDSHVGFSHTLETREQLRLLWQTPAFREKMRLGWQRRRLAKQLLASIPAAPILA